MLLLLFSGSAPPATITGYWGVLAVNPLSVEEFAPARFRRLETMLDTRLYELAT